MGKCTSVANVGEAWKYVFFDNVTRNKALNINSNFTYFLRYIELIILISFY